jgi:hypothetical protein
MKYLVLMFVVVSLLVAGCAGGEKPGAEEGKATPTPKPAATPTATPTTKPISPGTTPTQPPPSSPSEVWTPYDFKKGEYYKYKFTSKDESGYLTWKVKDISPDGNTVTVEYGYIMGDMQFSGTVTGPKESVYAQTMMTPVGPIIAMTLYAPYTGYFAGYPLAVGNEWSVTTPEGSASIKIEGKETHAGVEFYKIVYRVDGELALETCVSPALAFVGCMVIYDENGNKDFEITLVEYQAGG